MAKVKTGTLFLLLLCFVLLSCVLVRAGPVRLKSGDWIKYESINIGDVPFTSGISWSKVEFLSVTERTATIRVTMHMTNGTEWTRTRNIDVVSDSQDSVGYSGFVVSTDLNAGDSIPLSGIGNVKMIGETTRIYAGASRAVVYAPFSQSGQSASEVQTLSYWDKQTGIFLEETATSANFTISFKATETNIWSASLFERLGSWLLAILAVVIVTAATVTVFILFRRKSSSSQVDTTQNEDSGDKDHATRVQKTTGPLLVVVGVKRKILPKPVRIVL